jgi:Flp pilus assembly protein TadG
MARLPARLRHGWRDHGGSDHVGRHHGERGQTLVEFSFGIIIFLALFVGMVDLARAVFTFNGVSQAARELAREASLYPGVTLGASPEALAVLDTQRGLVPGLDAPVFQCVDLGGTVQLDTCQPGDWVRVSTSATFRPALPVLTALGPITVTSMSSAEIQ